MAWFRVLLSHFSSRFRSAAGAGPQGFREWPLHGIRFSEEGLTAGSASPTRMTWSGPDGFEVELTRSVADQVVDWTGLEDLRSQQRRIATANGRGLVLADVGTTGTGLPWVEVVTKGQRGAGYDYVGVASGSDGAHLYTVRVSAQEAGTTGVREAVVTALLWQLGELQLPAATTSAGGQALEGWFVDPYDSSWDDTALTSLADDERVDVVFPSHPLSRVRAFLAQVRRSVVFDARPEGSAARPGDAVAPPPSGHRRRRVLSDRAARELQWTHNCFDAVATGLEEALSALDGPSANRDERVAEHLLRLGVTQARQARHRDASACLSRALEMYEMLRGRDDVMAAVTLGHLARAHLELGNLEEAAEMFPQALAVLERLRPGHLVLGMTLSGYGRLLLDRDSVKAREYVLRASDIADSLGGGRRPFLLDETVGTWNVAAS